MNWKKIRNSIPNQIQLSRKTTYEIVWVDGFKDSSVLGETRFDAKQIAIKLGQSDKETVLTLYHEIYHALSGEYNANLTENQVLMLEKSLHYFLKFVIMNTKGIVNVKKKRNSRKVSKRSKKTR